MIEIVEDQDRLIVLRVSGTADVADYDQLGPWLEQRLAGPARPLRLLVLAQDWQGWADLDAAWADLRLDIRFAGKFERIAIVGDSRWQEWMTNLSRLFISTQLRWFDALQAAAAKTWVVERNVKEGA